MSTPVKNQIRMNFIRNDQHIVFDADLRHACKFVPAPYPSDGIVRTANQENSACSGLSGKIIKIDLPAPVLFQQPVFDHNSTAVLNDVAKVGIHRRLNENTILRIGKDVQNGAHGRDDAKTPAH